MSKQGIDSEALQSFNYKQELQRSLKFFSSFAVAFSFISITTGIFSSYSLALGAAGPAGIWTWPFVMVGHLLVALIFADLSSKIPLSGYVYQWVSRLTNRGFGWFTGWAALCYLIIVVPTVDYGVAPIFLDLFGIKSTTTVLTTVVLITIVIQALLNIYGVKIATIINNSAVYTEVIGFIGIIIILSIVLFFKGADFSLLTYTAHKVGSNGSYLTAFVLSVVMGSYTLVGFEAAANLAEETVDANKTVPKAIVYSMLLAGVIGFVFLIIVTSGIKDINRIMASASPISDILQSRLGTAVADFFLALVIVSIFACGLIIMASASRLIYALSRDNVFFASSVFKKVDKKHNVPYNAIILVSVLGIIAVFYFGKLSLLIGTSAALPAITYLITVIAYATKIKNLPDTDGFKLGKWRLPVTVLAIIWLVFEVGILTLPKDFLPTTKVILYLFLAGIIIYWTVFRSRIQEGKIGINLEKDLDM
ncbi:amino acid permease [Gottfriedia acidiceleris]|uniref:APC family permease n=1 Tax=Gottfriedia acidiceleris TaxID=371036 RepID=UPI002F26B8C6